MAVVPFDTPAVTRGLEARGFDAAQAEAITEAVRAGVTGGVATKAGLLLVSTELKGEMSELKGEMSALKTEMGQLRTEPRWIKVIGVAILAVLILTWLAELISGTMPGQ